MLQGERLAEVDDIVDRVRRWAADRPDVVGLLLVGSYARSAARPDSDVDLMLLTTDVDGYAGGVEESGLGTPVRVRSWGPITERRFVTASGLEVELNVGPVGWASTEPVDPGTRRVVTDGARVLHDPSGLLAALVDACRPPQEP